LRGHGVSAILKLVIQDNGRCETKAETETDAAASFCCFVVCHLPSAPLSSVRAVALRFGL